MSRKRTKPHLKVIVVGGMSSAVALWRCESWVHQWQQPVRQFAGLGRTPTAAYEMWKLKINRFTHSGGAREGAT